jgi:hypothetical protein
MNDKDKKPNARTAIWITTDVGSTARPTQKAVVAHDAMPRQVRNESRLSSALEVLSA